MRHCRRVLLMLLASICQLLFLRAGANCQSEAGDWPQCACPDPQIGSDVITSAYGARYFSASNPYDYHDAIDIAIPLLDPVHAIAAGQVIYASRHSYNYDIKIWSSGFTINGKYAEFMVGYIHPEEKSVNVGDYVLMGQTVGLSGTYGTGPHVHLTLRPDYVQNERRHPVRYLTKPIDLSCPQIAFGWSLNEAPGGGIENIAFTIHNMKSEKYDLSEIHVFLYDDQSAAEYVFDYEEKSIMDSWNYTGYVDFPTTGPAAVRVYVQPKSLDTGENYMETDVIVDPTGVPPSLEYIGIYLDDVYDAKTFSCVSDPFASIGNTTGESPGALCDLFEVESADNGNRVRWRGKSGVEAVGVRLHRVTAQGELGPIHDELLPFRDEGIHDEICVFVDGLARRYPACGYRLYAVLRNGSVLLAAELEGPASAVPAGFALHQNYPNPFNSSTAIRFTVGREGLPGQVSVNVFNLLGQHIATIFASAEEALPGEHTVEWDGNDRNGNPVPSGVYVYRLSSTNGVHQAKRMVVAR